MDTVFFIVRKTNCLVDLLKRWIHREYSEDICLQTFTSFSITWIKITRACGWQKSFQAGQILCAQTNFQHDFRQVSILELPSNFDSEAFS